MKLYKPTLLLLFLLNILFSQNLPAQNTLTGIVLNDKDHKPVDFASVYINGTTKGVYTDVKGNFTINNVSIPCQLIVTHLAYNLSQTPVEKTGTQKFTIYLTEKTNQLSGVYVSGTGKRKLIIKEFKDGFFGNDSWAKNALMKNDSVLYFSRRVDTIVRKANALEFQMLRKTGKMNEKDKFPNERSNIVSYVQVLSAKTKSPLLIELPLLGYSVYVDLVSFNLKSQNEWADCDYWAYYRFTPHTSKSDIKQAKIVKKRKEAYYNSAKHFCRSLFENRLKENGYLISLENDNDSVKKIQYIDINSYINIAKPNEVQVTGLKNKSIIIYYLCNYVGKPTDLTRKNINSNYANQWEHWNIENNSTITFKSDTCTIRSNGTIPDNNVLFSGKFATKRGGTLLPDDYLPDNDK